MSPQRLKVKGDRSLEDTLLRYEQWRTWLVGFAAVALLGLVGAAVVGVSILLDNSREAKEQREVLQGVADRVLSCTDPGVPQEGVPPQDWPHPPGDCYLANLERTASLVGDPPGGINTVVVLSAACAAAVVEPDDSQIDAQAATLECVRATLDRRAGG